MKKYEKKSSLVTLLFIGFLDYLGIGLIFPLFTLVLFDHGGAFLPVDASAFTRGAWLGFLLALGPGVQFFTAPLLGSLSDRRGRKKILLFCLGIGVVGYLIAIFGMWIQSLASLVIYRLLFGVSSGSVTVVQAALADLGGEEGKAKYFAFYTMALGAGFSLGPFFGASLSGIKWLGGWNHAAPFLFTALLTLGNFALVIFQYRESHRASLFASSKLLKGLKGFTKELRMVFLVLFVFFFGWNFFCEFAPVFLISQYAFDAIRIGYFYAYTGIFYALSAAFVVGRLLCRFSPAKIMMYSLLLGGGYLFFFVGVKNASWIWVYVLPFLFCISLIYPAGMTIISNLASKDTQGEALGIYNSIQSLALIIAPLLFGSLAGAYPTLTVTLTALFMCAAGVLLWAFSSKLERA